MLSKKRTTRSVPVSSKHPGTPRPLAGRSIHSKPPLATYRSEPVWIRPSPRLGLGIPKGWEKNFFLEFAPNLTQLVTKSGDIRRGGDTPISKQQMLTEFFDEIGENLSSCGLKQKEKSLSQQKDEYAPSTWEVRERLRELVGEHECRMEEKMYESSKYPLLVKGELDPKLAMKTERKKLMKKEQEEKDTKYLSTAKSKIKESQQKGASDSSKTTENAKVHAQVEAFYKQSRNSYHKKAAPTRFHIERK